MNSVSVTETWKREYFLQGFRLMGLGSQCLVFGPQSNLVFFRKNAWSLFKKQKIRKKEKEKIIGDTWKCLAAPCSRQAVRLGVSQPGLELHPCWIILSATLVKSFVWFASLALALHAKLPGGIQQREFYPSDVRLLFTYGPACESCFLSASVGRSLQEQSPNGAPRCWEEKGTYYWDVLLFHLTL